MSGDIYYFKLGGISVPVNGKMQQILGRHDINHDHVLDEEDFAFFLDRQEVLANAYLGAAKASGYFCGDITGKDLKIIGGAADPIGRAYSSLTRGDCGRLVSDAGFSNTNFDLLISQASVLRSGIGKLTFAQHSTWAYSGAIIFTMPCDIPQEMKDAITSVLYKGAYVYFHTAQKEVCGSKEQVPGVVRDRNYVISTCSIGDLSVDEVVPLLPFETDKIEIFEADVPYTGVDW